MFRNIVVGLSGGVDSAVAALLLKRKGFNVTAVFLRNWDTADETGKCLADEDYKDAEYVARKINIPLVEVNFVKEYWHEVFTYLLESYESGCTPNPDIMCNKNIKFKKFYDFARENLKADAIATGHYAISSFGPYLEDYKPGAKMKLLHAVDRKKDQTFFLSQVSQESLQRCMFPVGGLLKSDVKKLAIEADLRAIAQKPESMGICFIGTRTFQNFIPHYLENKPGNFVNYDTGEVVAQHQGIHYWTLGQRCRIAGAYEKFFVLRKDVKTNDILVVPGTDHPALFSRILVTSKPHWIREEPEQLIDSWTILNCEYRFQRNEKLCPCIVYKSLSDKLIIISEREKRAISPGQFVVLYLNDECLGSAPIVHTGPSLHSLGATRASSDSEDSDGFLEASINSVN
ncbi:mitochondrial tRNA-specific 2-thiouridylase 1 [Diachasma alloeum]|uniref:mitochondrial tRNA-specific 2-thiouridylase 1 n=1 Tax=Diachasma alloeum TaxID=454923 RepID=UPI0007381E9A|nr:mitochondrial tRNA-specific 2-thiouridylase 1 [Diachasma alloeum]XP_015117010.1 mitochondrial tRNA-specific 2-thiouridylase 1 [Diachasma alloeum]